MPLTDTTIRQAKPADKAFKLSDGGGLYLLVKPAGKYWRMDYRFAGKRKTIAIGVYPTVRLKDARVKRDESKRLLADGVDPIAIKKEKKRAAKVAAENSFELVAREWAETNKPRWTPRHAGYIMRRLESDIFPAIGHRPINEIAPMEILDPLRAMEKRGATDLPNRIRATVAQVFKYGIITEW
ncbi:MAG: integrase arm-type DNA-binding domain-containing protein [Magnetococcales bacterium]|nr:integrase arm-type DNA-binding domain-containing protein [Magnetococcales bacterium]